MNRESKEPLVTKIQLESVKRKPSLQIVLKC